MSSQDSPNSSPIGCLLRLFWMFGGLGVLLLLSISIAEHRSTLITNILYWLVVAGVIISRFVDIRYFNGQTSEGNPATLRDWRRYALLIFIISAAVFILIHAKNRFF